MCSNQKVSACLAKLVEESRVTKIVEKKKSYFSIRKKGDSESDQYVDDIICKIEKENI